MTISDAGIICERLATLEEAVRNLCAENRRVNTVCPDCQRLLAMHGAELLGIRRDIDDSDDEMKWLRRWMIGSLAAGVTGVATSIVNYFIKN